MDLFKALMDEFNYVKNAYQYYIGFLVNIATFLYVSYQNPVQTLCIVIVLYIAARFLGKWHYESKNSGFNRQNYMIGKYSPPWQTLFKVLYILAENNPDAKQELEEWL